MDWGDKAQPSEMGKGNHPAQNPPELTEHDEFCLFWFNRYCTGFVKEYGLSAFFFQKLELETDEATLFLYKLDMIYLAGVEIWKERMKRENA
jgi:hypothetical protein